MFEDVLNDHQWNPIRGCPGRYILAEGIISQPLSEFLGFDNAVRSGASGRVPDPFEFVKIEGGGLISYKKDGGWLHTLCDAEGFARKLRSLGVELDEFDSEPAVEA